ncbi:unnamed protein product, partial [Porites lobata]
DLTYGNIRTINEKEVKTYTHLEFLFINHNPLDCDHATTYTLKHVVIEIMKLKSFHGHKIKCLNLKRSPYGMAASGKKDHASSVTNVSIHGFIDHQPPNFRTPRTVAEVLFTTFLGMMAVVGWMVVVFLCWVAVNFVKKLSGAQDPVSQMEEGTAAETQSQDTAAQALIEGLKRQRRNSQGFPENAIVNSEDDDVIEEEDYLKEKMKKQRRHSQGYATEAVSSDEESNMVEINLNEARSP